MIDFKVSLVAIDIFYNKQYCKNIDWIRDNGYKTDNFQLFGSMIRFYQNDIIDDVPLIGQNHFDGNIGMIFQILNSCDLKLETKK